MFFIIPNKFNKNDRIKVTIHYCKPRKSINFHTQYFYKDNILAVLVQMIVIEYENLLKSQTLIKHVVFVLHFCFIVPIYKRQLK